MTVNYPKLNGADKAKYEIYDAMKLVIQKSHNLKKLSDSLCRYGTHSTIKHRRGSDIIVGISLEKDGYKFKGPEIDRIISHAELQKMFGALTYLGEKRKKEIREKPTTPTIEGV